MPGLQSKSDQEYCSEIENYGSLNSEASLPDIASESIHMSDMLRNVLDSDAGGRSSIRMNAQPNALEPRRHLPRDIPIAGPLGILTTITSEDINSLQIWERTSNETAYLIERALHEVLQRDYKALEAQAVLSSECCEELESRSQDSLVESKKTSSPYLTVFPWTSGLQHETVSLKVEPAQSLSVHLASGAESLFIIVQSKDNIS